MYNQLEDHLAPLNFLSSSSRNCLLSLKVRDRRCPGGLNLNHALRSGACSPKVPELLLWYVHKTDTAERDTLEGSLTDQSVPEGMYESGGDFLCIRALPFCASPHLSLGSPNRAIREDRDTVDLLMGTEKHTRKQKCLLTEGCNINSLAIGLDHLRSVTTTPLIHQASLVIMVHCSLKVLILAVAGATGLASAAPASEVSERGLDKRGFPGQKKKFGAAWPKNDNPLQINNFLNGWWYNWETSPNGVNPSNGMPYVPMMHTLGGNWNQYFTNDVLNNQGNFPYVVAQIPSFTCPADISLDADV